MSLVPGCNSGHVRPIQQNTIGETSPSKVQFDTPAKGYGMALRGHGWKGPLFVGWVAAFCFFIMNSWAQAPKERITAQIDNSERSAIQGSHPPMARPENEAGRVPGQTRLEGMSIVFSRTAVQEADLQALIASQHDPASPLYQKWLTPEEFGARFGVADTDLAKVQFWLQQQGFSIESISRSRNRITFSGTVGQAEAAFATELHFYSVNGKREFAPWADISVPAALSSVVHTVTNLSTFRPKPHVKVRPPQPAPTANFTSSQSGNHFLTPKDVATIYDVNAAYNAGYTGAGQAIAVVGQSSIVLTDIEHFQTAAGLAVKDPTLILVPNSGTATVSSGDELESDLDLEYSGGIAKGATIYFVYTGNNASYSVWDSLTYAIQNKTAPVISISYGACELGLSQSQYSSLNAVLAQGASQGQTVVAASGDSGSTDCHGETGLTTAQQQALAVDFPASSEYVTGMGGSEFFTADVAAANTTYWQAASGSDVISSALSYIPEQVWNDDSSMFGISSGGGGVSTFTPRPSWQTGVPGIPSSGSNRFVPDISLTGSPNNAGFLYCSSDSRTGVTGSCSNGFRDSTNINLTVAGGTSFDAPIFSGMLALVLQKLNSSGLGVANTTLYTLAANSVTYASAFHDITSGNNECTAGPTFCSSAGASEYPATTAYDEASGLGSVDLFNLLQAWPTSGSTPVASKTTLSAATTTPASGANDAITIKVVSGSSSSTTTPTGTLSIAVDGTTVNSALALSGGSATYTFSSTVVGSHTITATYSGDSTYATSTGNLTLTVGTTALATSTALSAATITPASGATDAISIRVASASSSSTTTPTGTLSIAVDGTTVTSSLALTGGSATYVFSSTTAGSHAVTATYSGDSTYAASTGTLTLTVVPAPVATTTTLSAATNTPAFGAGDAISIKVASASSSSTTTPTGTLTIAVDNTIVNPSAALTAGSAMYSFSSTIAGSHTITAIYSGDSTYAASTGTLTVTVGPAPVATTTVLSAATTTPAFGASDVITIKVASASSSSTATPTGTLMITIDGTTATSSLALSGGSATYAFSSTTAGSHTVAATYSGNSTYASSSGSVTLTVASAPVATTTALSAATTAPASGASDVITIRVASASSSSTATPTGIVAIAVDGATVNSSLTLSGGSATYAFSSTTAGPHTVAATYSGDFTYAPSNGSVTLTVSSLPKSFTLTATNATIPSGSTGTSTIIITPQNGYTGTVGWSVSSSPSIANACFSLPNTSVSSSSAVNATLTIRTSATACATGAVSGPRGTTGKSVSTAPMASRKDVPATAPWSTAQTSLGMAGFLFVGLLGFRSRKLATFVGVLLFAVVGLSVGGCAGSLSPPPSSTVSNAAKGTYTVTVVGTDTSTASITTTATLTLTID